MLLVPGLAACGDDGDAPAKAKASTREPAEVARKWDPTVSGRELMSLKRLGLFYGTSDLVKYGSDGSVVVIKMYGGGGSGVERCHLRAGELQALRHDLRRMPLDPPPHRRERPRPTFYTPTTPQFLLTVGKYQETFTEDAAPRDARPLVRRLERTLNGRVAACRTVYRTKKA
ncbi:MAG: hypothetical protein HZB46_09500 [Solirubrobacterales bacterium]|nr:hypothetical protein [Solirubrobacterales bacterium]